MPGPWEKYASAASTSPAAPGPWAKYGGSSGAQSAPSEPTLAEKAVDVISPEVSGPPSPGESFLTRLARGTRQTLFPTSMGEVKSLFNPNAGQYGVSRILEEEGKRIGASVRGAAQNSADQIATSQFGQKNPEIAAALGAGYGTAADVASDSLTPSSFQQSLGAEAMGPVIKETGAYLKDAAIDPARRALGFQKSQLVSQKSPFETTRKIAQANKSAKAMLEADAISPVGSVPDTMENATKILSDGSRKMSSVMDEVDKTGKVVPVRSIDSSLIDDLKPKFDDEIKATDKILNDLKAFGKDGLSLAEMDELRARWGKIGFQDKTVNGTESNMYREAFKSIDRQVKKHIESVSPDLLKDYVSGKSAQENAINALRGLGNKRAADLGNNIFSLPTKVLAAGQLASGDVVGALATAGVSEGIRRRGMAALARGTYGAGRALEKGAAPGFLATLQASARKALGNDGGKKSRPNGKPFISLSGPLNAALAPGTRDVRAETIPGVPMLDSKPLTEDQKLYANGLQLRLNGNREEAKRLWQKALKSNPKNYWAREGLERLASEDGVDSDSYKPR